MQAIQRAERGTGNGGSGLWAGLLALALAAPGAGAGTPVTVNFEDLSYAAGQDYYHGADGAGGFVSHGFHFETRYTDWGGGFTSWAGFAHSRVADAVTAGFGNQHAALPGGGSGPAGETVVGGSYAVVYVGTLGETVLRVPTGYRATLGRVRITNTTYAGLSMRHGDDFAKKFGGPTGEDPDYLRLTIHGRDQHGALTGAVEVFLADYRPAGTAQDVLLDTWREVDLSPLGTELASVTFSIISSDFGSFGMNTPAYFAMDNLEAELHPRPIPGAVVLTGVWQESPWLGVFAAGEGSWIFHTDWGWMHVAEAAGGFWLYHPDLGWFWTSPAQYPWVCFPEEGWFYQVKGAGRPWLLAAANLSGGAAPLD